MNGSIGTRVEVLRRALVTLVDEFRELKPGGVLLGLDVSDCLADDTLVATVRSLEASADALERLAAESAAKTEVTRASFTYTESDDGKGSQFTLVIPGYGEDVVEQIHDQTRRVLQLMLGRYIDEHNTMMEMMMLSIAAIAAKPALLDDDLVAEAISHGDAIGLASTTGVLGVGLDDE